MKKTVVLLILLFTTPAFAGPFLICDPQASVTLYDIYADGTLIVADHPAEPDGSLKYELVSSMPSVTFTAVAKNIWGVSPESDPYLSPPLAGKPLNLRLEE